MPAPKIDQMFTQVIYGTFPNSITAFLVDRKAQGLSPNTLRCYTTELRLFTEYLQRQGVITLDELTPDVIRLYLLDLTERRNPGGCRVSYRVIKTFCIWLENETDGEYKNPIRKVKSPRVPEEPLDPVPLVDVEKMLETCAHDWHGERDRAIILVLLDTGVRAAELCALDFSDLDLTSSSLQVRQGKGRKPRTVFIGKRSRRAIRSWLRCRGSGGNSLFLTDEHERITYWGLRQIIRRRALRAGISEPSLHDFRRAFCLAQLQAGVPETAIARMMGHVDIRLIARYAKQLPGDLGELYRSPADRCYCIKFP
jgi:integrase/recombinase XerD